MDVALLDRKLTVANLLNNRELPKGELVLTSVDGNYEKESYRLAYYFDLYGKETLNAYRVYVDAKTGTVIQRSSLISNCFSHNHEAPSRKSSALSEQKLSARATTASAPMIAATFNSLYLRGNPTPTFEVEPVGAGSRLTMSTNVNQALQTRRDQNNNGVFDDPELTNPSLNWGNNEQNATLAHWVVYRSYEYFKNRFGLNGTDGQGDIARVFILPLLNGAFWNYNDRLMLVGRNENTGTILSTVDIVGHEYGHGVTNQLVGGWQRNNSEQGSLNEGFSDIIGTAMERELLPSGAPGDVWNWQIGENAWFVRNMADPHAFNQPQTYQEPNFWIFSPNNPHHNNGVLNKWFHTLCTGQGPNGNNITPISFDDAMRVVHWALEYTIYGDYGYVNTAHALKSAAGTVFGRCSPQELAVAAAWETAGINVGRCTPDCNYAAYNISPVSVGCNQPITLNLNCGAATSDNYNSYTCQNVIYQFGGPNVPYNYGNSSSLNVTAPANAGNYQYSVAMSKPSSVCYTRTYYFNVNVNCGSTATCDFSTPRYVGTWNGLTVQIRSISGKNVLVTAITGSPSDKYYPRGDNFWGSFSLDPNAAGLQGCLNAGSTGYGGLIIPDGLNPPSGYYRGTESDGAQFFELNGGNTPNPCDFSSGPRQVGTWNGMNVQIRQYPGDKRVLVTAVPGASNDKHYPRGDNFWDNFTKDAGAEQYRPCLNAGETGYYGLVFPGGVTPSPGYQQGSESDGAVFFSTNGLREAAPEPTPEEVALVKIRPNPVHDEVTVTFFLEEAGTVKIRLVDLKGRSLLQQVCQGIAGKNERTLSVSSLTVGMYALEVMLGKQRIVHKLVKE